MSTPPKPHIPCKECGKMFKPRTDKKQRYCSRKCGSAHRRIEETIQERYKRQWRNRVANMSEQSRQKMLENQRKRYKEWRKRNPETYQTQGRKSRLKLKMTVLNAYGKICACCSEGQYQFLAIDHINGGGSKHVRSIRQKGKGWKLYQWLKNEGFPKGFRVLCHNCNQAIGAYGYCPHQTIPQP